MKKCCLILCLLFQLSCFAQVQQLPWFPFNWSGNFLKNKYLAKGAMVLPLGATGGDREIFNIQIDTGCEGTFYYDQSYMDANHLKGNYLANFLRNKMIDSSIHTFFTDMDKTLKKQFTCDSLTIRKVNHKQIGVIGSDIFSNKILIIDYPNTRMCIVDSVNAVFQKQFDIIDMKVIHTWPVIPVQINGDKKWVIFDTGSSLMELTTTKANWDLLVDHQMPVDTLGPLNSWGTPVSMYSSRLKYGCKIGNTDYSQCRIWYSDNDRIENTILKPNNLFGVMGNALYWNTTVMIDYKNKRFGIKK